MNIDKTSEEHGRKRREISDQTCVLVENVGRPGSIAVDWVNKNLYWIDMDQSSVSLINIDSRLQRRIITSHLASPQDVVVDPDSAQLFIADTGLNPKILTAWLDGSHLKPLVESKIQWPSALSIDYPARRLYWTDMKRKTIETVQLNGHQRKLISYVEPKLGKPFKLEIFEDSVYFTTFKINRVLKINKFGKGNITEIAEEIVSVTDLTIMQENKHDDLYTAYPCQNLPCKDYGQGAVCVSVPADEHNLTFKCLCSEGYVLEKKKCVKVPDSSSPSDCSGISCIKGVCLMDWDNKPTCICEPHYNGKFCDNQGCHEYSNYSNYSNKKL